MSDKVEVEASEVERATTRRVYEIQHKRTMLGSGVTQWVPFDSAQTVEGAKQTLKYWRHDAVENGRDPNVYRAVMVETVTTTTRTPMEF